MCTKGQPGRSVAYQKERMGVFKWGQLARTHPSKLDSMMCCAYCGEPATMKIPSNPEQVCSRHALEFWTGVLASPRDPSEASVKHEPACACRSCEELTASYLQDSAKAAASEELSAANRRAMAVAAAGPSPGEKSLPTSLES